MNLLVNLASVDTVHDGRSGVVVGKDAHIGIIGLAAVIDDNIMVLPKSHYLVRVSRAEYEHDVTVLERLGDGHVGRLDAANLVTILLVDHDTVPFAFWVLDASKLA